MTDRIRYARLGYVSLCATNLDATRQFYEHGIGLQLSGSKPGQLRFRCSDKPHDLIFEQSSTPGLRRVAFELEDEWQLRAAFDRISHLGLSPVCLQPAQTRDFQVETGFRFVNPNSGLELEFYAGQEKSPTPFQATQASIARLGHVVLNVADFESEFDFWVNKLGFEVSDYVPGRIAFLRCFPNPLHHSAALVAGPANGLNHVNFMVTDIDDVGRAIYRMRNIGAPIVFGPGRHAPSGSIFLYFLDPDGMTMEYSFGMELFDEIGAREPRLLEPKPEVLDMWGGLPTPEFGKVGQIITAHG
ncbi:MAG: VOC family protein [Caulobacterales bacterium]